MGRCWMFNDNSRVIEYINSLSGYEGFVQFSHRPIDIEKDVFVDQEPKVEDEKEGFIYEAYFFNGSDSISIRQVNSGWIEHKESNISLKHVEKFYAIDSLEIKMAQQWKPQEDKNCANMQVMKLEKVLFAGFEKGENNDNSTI